MLPSYGEDRQTDGDEFAKSGFVIEDQVRLFLLAIGCCTMRPYDKCLYKNDGAETSVNLFQDLGQNLKFSFLCMRNPRNYPVVSKCSPYLS